jgi:hypothetical protein
MLSKNFPCSQGDRIGGLGRVLDRGSRGMAIWAAAVATRQETLR